ncbi:hypothetical protein [Paenibacillus sp. NPDC058174]|uniref:hypothetical protein n=1 Tax=Paenibacillus sp. NPDC058174 TaxID=3346366 RepID=UPI0036D904C5
MKESLIYITDDITFQDIKNDKVKKTEVYLKQMNNWFIKPAKLLLDSSRKQGNYEQELALLTILITFFESHGQYLKGKSSQVSSKKVFTYAFKAYLDYLVNVKKHSAEIYQQLDLTKFYSLVRCGLLHNGYIRNEGVSFFIDRLKLDKVHVVYPNKIISNSWLINTYCMLEGLEDYLMYYLNLVEYDMEYKSNFEKMFESFYTLD